MAVFSCPIGSLQHFMTIRAVPFLLMGSLGMIGLLVGRMGCGWLCPFGLIQDLVYKIPAKKISIPRPLLQFKYVTLVFLVIIIPFATGAPWFSKLCPYGTLTAGIPWVLIDSADPQTGVPVIAGADFGGLFALKVGILVAFVALFAMTKRPFCRTTCPLGAIFSLFNRFSLVQLRVSSGCRDCGACKGKCPVDIQVSEDANSGECIRCLGCTSCENVKVELRPLGLSPRPLSEAAERYNE
jgi:polyferredoxin